MKFLIKNKNPIRSLFAILFFGNIGIFFIASFGFWSLSPQFIFVFYNLVCALILYLLSKRQLSVEIMSDYMLITGLLTTKKIRKSDIKSIEVETYGSNGKSIGICRLGVSASSAVMFTEDMFVESGDYNALVKCLGWVENKYSHHREVSWRGAATFCSEQLVTCLFALVMIILNVVLFSLSQDDFSAVMNKFDFSASAIEAGEYYRFITAFFLHINFSHLLVNLTSLGLFGGMLERYLGRARYFNVVMLSAFSGWIFALIFSQFNHAVGASGGIYGLFGAYVALKVISKGVLQPSVDPMSFRWVVFILIFQVGSDLYTYNSSLSAHMGGFVGGVACFILLRLAFERAAALEKVFSFGLLLLCLLSFLILIS